MEIVNFGHFTANPQGAIVFYQNEDRQDWYDLRRSLTNWGESGEFIDAIYGAWAMVDPATMRVTNVEYDPSRMVPDDKIILGIDADHTEIKVGMVYEDGTLKDIPPPLITPETISDRQFFQVLANRELITKAEALAAVTTGALPAAIEALVTSLAVEEEFNARMLLQGATEFRRSHPLTETLGAGLGMTPEQIDELWIDAHEL